MKSGIYKITNIITNKFYIGSSSNIMKRKYNHFSSLKHNRHCNKYLQSSYNKYGKDNFILEECDKNNLINREQYYIDTVKPEYNLCKIADRPTGLKHTEKHKRYMSAHMKNIRKTDKFKNSNLALAVLTEDIVNNIVKDIKLYKSTKYIINKYDITRSNFYSIRSGKIWKNITNIITKEDIIKQNLVSRESSYKGIGTKISNPDIIMELYDKGISYIKIAKQLGVHRDTIYKTLKRSKNELQD